MPPRDEFYDLYFSGFRCPSCKVRHETPVFHREIRAAADAGHRRLLVNLPPYHAKSTEITVNDTVFDIVRDPNLRTIIVSKSLSFARLFIGQLQELLENRDLYLDAPRNLVDDWGPFRGQGAWSSEQFFVAGRTTSEKDATVQALGVGGQIYGRRADKIKFDDVATLENQGTPERVASMLEWIDKEALSRIGFQDPAWFVGTRVTPGDIYGHLRKRDGYVTLEYPAIMDESRELMLWGDHFTYADAVARRAEMTPQDWQLVYQQVASAGAMADFPWETLERGLDPSRTTGHFDPNWILVAGLDLAGGTRRAGFTCGTIVGIDREGRRYLVDTFNRQAMRPAALRDQLIMWGESYPLTELRVEKNGLQAQLVQYNDEIARPLAALGVRIVPHQTQGNKWDQDFGVRSMAPLFGGEMISVPWATGQDRAIWQPLLDQLSLFPLGAVNDRVMSLWFADLAARDHQRRGSMPLFSQQQRVPERVARRRMIYTPGEGLRRVPLGEQRTRGMRVNGRRLLVGARRQSDGIPEDYEGPDPSIL